MLLTVCHSHIPVGRLLVFLKINRSFLVWGEENEGKICKRALTSSGRPEPINFIKLSNDGDKDDLRSVE
jgi:hypothetical protein